MFFIFTDITCSSYTNGYTCAVKSIDENWYRAEIINVTDSDITVKYIDYGNTETIARNYVKDLADKFKKIATYAVRVYLPLLSEFGDNETVVNKMTALTKDYILSMTILEHYKNNQWIVDIGLNDMSIIDAMKAEKLGNQLNLTKLRAQIDGDLLNMEPMIVDAIVTDLPVINSVHENAIESNEPHDNANESIDDNSLITAFISHVDSPEKFYLQLKCDQSSLDRLQENLQIVAQSLPALDNFTIGTHCIVKYFNDNLWYRAVILDTDTEVTSIRFIDYGNYDTITDSTLIRSMNDAFLDVPDFAICCSLPIACQSNQSEWPADACKFLYDIVNNPVQFRYICRTKTINFIELYQMERDITKEILTAGYGIALNCISDNEQCYVSHTNSLTDFYIQLSKDTDALEKMSGYLNDEVNMLPLQDFTNIENSMCIAQFDDDYAWYRAKILQHTEDNNLIEVLFIDYGNTSFVTNVCRFKEPKIAELPALSKHCELRLPDNVREWSKIAEQKFVELTGEGSVVLTVKVVSLGQKSIIDLYLENGDCISDILSEDCLKHDNEKLPIELDDNVANEVVSSKIDEINRKSGFVIYIVSPKDFYTHLESHQDDVDYLANTLKAEADTYPVCQEINIDDICVAKFDEDQLYYRVKICEKLNDTEYRVHFIDYGNFSTTSDLRQAPDYILAITPLALHCTIEKSPNELLTETQLKQFDDIINLEDEYEIEMIDDSQKPYVIRLYLNGQDIYECLEKNEHDDDDDTSQNIVHEIVTEVLDHIHENNDIALGIVTDIVKQLEKTNDDPNKLSTIYEQSISSNDIEPIRDDPLIDAFIIYGTSPTNFYIQLNDSTEMIKNVIDKLLDADQFPLISEPHVDLLCIAKCTDDNLYYRAKILSINDAETNSCEVFFIDYGNTQTSNDLHIIPNDLSEIEPQAIHCTIKGINSTSEIAETNFNNIFLSDLSQMYRIKMYAKNDDDNDDKISIDMYDENDCNLFDVLVNATNNDDKNMDHHYESTTTITATDVCSNVDATNVPSNITNLVTCTFRKSSEDIAKEFLLEIVRDITKIVTIKSNHGSLENLIEIRQEIFENVLSNSIVNEKLGNAVTQLLNVEKSTGDSSDCSQAASTANDELLTVNGHQEEESTNNIDTASVAESTLSNGE